MHALRRYGNSDTAFASGAATSRRVRKHTRQMPALVGAGKGVPIKELRMVIIHRTADPDVPAAWVSRNLDCTNCGAMFEVEAYDVGERGEWLYIEKRNEAGVREDARLTGPCPCVGCGATYVQTFIWTGRWR